MGSPSGRRTNAAPGRLGGRRWFTVPHESASSCHPPATRLTRHGNATRVLGAETVQRALVQAEKLDPQPQVVVALGLLKTNPRPMSSSLKSIDVPLR